MMNWAWDGETVHQSQCPQAYVFDQDCLCMESRDSNIHCMPDWQPHQCSSACPCFPSVISYDDDGELVWLHQVIQ